MANIVIGTAGHIDHGKTTLVKALTGISTDTTSEEQKRGMSINLGFAYLDLDAHTRVGIVDVPGHEKFIKNMVAGLNGINLVLLVIDVNEGIMPQTKEHVDILNLLGIKDYIIVLTKTANVDEDMKQLVIDEIRETFINTPLQDSIIVETDAVANIGIDKLKQEIKKFVDNYQFVNKNSIARLNIDRVFSVKGFGSVVTGTLLDGDLKVSDELYLYPSKKKLRIRNLQVHETDVQVAHANQRTAINLANIDVSELERGMVLCKEDILTNSFMLDVKINTLKNCSIKLWDRVRLLIGSKEVMARVVPIGVEVIEGNSSCFAQLRLEEKVALKAHDRFILRSYSPLITIAGGEILDASAKKHRRFKENVLSTLKAKEDGNIAGLIDDYLVNTSNIVEDKEHLQSYFDLDDNMFNKCITELYNHQRVISVENKLFMSKDVYEYFLKFINKTLSSYHKKYSLRLGMKIEEFRSKLRNKNVSDKIIKLLIEFFIKTDVIKVIDNLVSLKDFSVNFDDHQNQIKTKIINKLACNGLVPIKKTELVYSDEEEVLTALVNTYVVFLDNEYVLSIDSLNKAKKLIKDFIKTNDQIRLADFRDISNTNRKTSMLILEYLDSINFTKRVDDYRVLNERGE